MNSSVSTNNTVELNFTFKVKENWNEKADVNFNNQEVIRLSEL